jgi:surfeit locus 1 family protein
MMGFKPRFWATVIAFTMMAITIGLGTWQVHRLAWKTDLLAKIAARRNGDAVPLPADISDAPGWAFRHVRVAGHFDAAHALWLYGRTYDGKAGIHLLVPLVRAEGDAVLVDRGFVPFEHGSALAQYRPADGDAEIDGIARQPEPGGLFVPANQPDKNIWYSVDAPAMSKVAERALAPIYIAAKSDGSPGWPAATGGTEGAGIRNEHLNYAIFWYSMTLVLGVIYVMSSRVRPKPSNLR